MLDLIIKRDGVGERRQYVSCTFVKLSKNKLHKIFSNGIKKGGTMPIIYTLSASIYTFPFPHLKS